MDQTRRDYSKKILDRIASDPTFREELLDDPKGAIERAGLKWEGPASEDVSGYSLFGGSPLPLPPTPTGGESNLLMGFQCNTVGTGEGKGIIDPGDPTDPLPDPKGK